MVTRIEAQRVGGGVRTSLGSRGAVILATAMLVLVVAIASGPGRASATPSVAPHGQIWISTVATAATLAHIDPAITTTFLSGQQSVTLGGISTAPTAKTWASEAAFAADLAANRIPPSVRIVLYDPEGWADTPEAERVDPVRAMAAFGALARRSGYVAVITPHPNLVEVPGAVCGAAPGEPLTAAYLRCGIQGAAARAADVVEIQGQYLENDAGAYHDFVAAAAAQARRASPGVTVISGLSTTFTDDPGVIYAAWHSVLGIVDGHYLNVPHGIRAQVAVGFLRMVAVD
jgi:hypothetical protein